MEKENSDKLRKLVKNTLQEMKLLKETIPDEAYSNIGPADMNAWLIYFKHYSEIADEAIGNILDIATNKQLSYYGRLSQIIRERQNYQTKISALSEPYLD